jgi:hypothetical protein
VAHEFIPVEISNTPDLEHLAESVRKTGKPHALKRGAETLAVVRPAPQKEVGMRFPRRRRSGILRPDDALFQLAGIGASGRGDVSSNKHKYLADAYAARPK